MTSKGLKLAVLVVVFIIVILIILAISSIPPSVEKIYPILHTEYDIDGDGFYDGIKVEYHIDSSGFKSYSSKGTLIIRYNGNTVYSKEIRCKEGDGEVFVKYTDFVLDNGNYELIVKFGDKTEQKTINIDWVVGYIDINEPKISVTSTEPKVYVNLTIGLYANSSKVAPYSKPQNLDVEVIVYNENGTTIWSKNQHIDVLNSFFLDYSFSKPYVSGTWIRGNYSILATITNGNVKTMDKSRYIVKNNKSVYLDAPPIAKLEADKTQISSFDTKVTFDASKSFDDGIIVSYTWYILRPLQDWEVIYSESLEDAQDGSFDGIYIHDFSDESKGTYLVKVVVLDDRNNLCESESIRISKTLI